MEGIFCEGGEFPGWQTNLSINFIRAFLLLCCLYLVTATPPVNAQSWSAWKQVAQEQMSQGHLSEAEKSWRRALDLVRDSGGKDFRLYISALELAKVLVAEKKMDDACDSLASVCTDDLVKLDLICEQEGSCLQTYLDLLKETDHKTETERVEKLLVAVRGKEKSSSSQGEKTVSILFGTAAEEELKKKMTSAQKLMAEKNYTAAESDLNDALQTATVMHKPIKVIAVLTEQSKLYIALKDFVKAERAYKTVLDQTSEQFGRENRTYLEALGFHAKLLHLKGEKSLAEEEEKAYKNLSNNLRSKEIAAAASAAAVKVPGSGATNPSPTPHETTFDPSTMGNDFKVSGDITLADLMAQADQGSKDLSLLKFVCRALYLNKDYQHCLVYAQKIVALEPDKAENQLLLAGVYLELEQPNNAVQPAKRALSLSPSPETYGHMVGIYGECGDMANQMQALKDFIARFPDNPKTPEYQFRLSKLDKAIKEADATEASTSTQVELQRCWKNRVPMPLKVFLADNTTANQIVVRPDGSGSKKPRDLCQEALDSWSSASGGRISFVLVPNAGEAQITIGYSFRADAILSENCAAGVTRWPGDLSKAIIFLGLVDNDGNAIYRDVFYATALHEIGHALGLEHSKGADDVMYWQERSVQPRGLSSNDQRRINTLYGY